MGQSSEPSVEEILASIKKVIARDSRDAKAEPPARRNPQASPAPFEASEITDDDEIFDLAAEAELADDLAAGDEPAQPGPLVTDESRLSMRESLAALSVMAQPGATPQIVRSGETSLEGMARELLRPALADWLDKNLPPLVERMVAAEIARIVGKKT